MTTLSVPPGCTGIELPNGKKIDANKQGKVEVNDPTVEKFALNSTAGKMGALGRTAYSFNVRSSKSKHCSSCAFTGWKWQAVCPHCGGEMIQTKETDQ